MKVLRFGRRRRAAITALVAATLVAGGLALAAPASAYKLNGCRFSGTAPGISVYNGAIIAKYVTATSAGMSRWNAKALGPTFLSVTSSSARKVLVTGWNSAESYYAVTSGSCSSGIWSGTVTFTWNDTTVHSFSVTALRTIATHEFGHTLGIADIAQAANCSGTKRVMEQGPNKWSCDWGTEPWTDDINGVKYIY